MRAAGTVNNNSEEVETGTYGNFDAPPTLRNRYRLNDQVQKMYSVDRDFRI